MGLERQRQVALAAARAGGEILRGRFGKVKNLDYKGAFNIVTEVDRAAEKEVVGILKGEFPEYGIIAEEGGAIGRDAACKWLIDPLDGTTNYVHSYPFFAVSIGLEMDGRLVLGVVYNPLADELFWAAQGKGAWLNESRLAASSVSSISESLLATGFPPDSRTSEHDNMSEFVALTGLSHGVRRDGSAALDLCFVAAGRLDGFWEGPLAPWDLGAGIPIVEEAGGKVTDYEGGPCDIYEGFVVASNGLIHDTIIAELAKLREGQ